MKNTQKIGGVKFDKYPDPSFYISIPPIHGQNKSIWRSFLYFEDALNKRKAAKAYFDEQKLEKLPTIKMLQTEYAALAAEKKTLYTGYHTTRKLMQDILSAKQNVDEMLGYRGNETDRDSGRAGR